MKHPQNRARRAFVKFAGLSAGAPLPPAVLCVMCPSVSNGPRTTESAVDAGVAGRVGRR